jgi:hypothetical protein
MLGSLSVLFNISWLQILHPLFMYWWAIFLGDIDYLVSQALVGLKQIIDWEA